jgi:SET domain-containing protein
MGKRVGLGRPGAKERVKVGRSPLHGRGLFANKRIRKDAYIATFLGDVTTEDGMHVLWALDENDNEVGIRGRNDLRFLNHSRNPNAEFIGTELHATRNIEAESELLIDYGNDWVDID